MNKLLEQDQKSKHRTKAVLQKNQQVLERQQRNIYQNLLCQEPSSKIFSNEQQIKLDSIRTMNPIHSQSQLVMKTTTLQFHSKKSTSQGEGPAPWTIQNWLPTRSNTFAYKLRPNIEKQEQYENVKKIKKNRNIGFQNCRFKQFNKDTQSLLRKNSLYLLNYITTKERRSVSIAKVKNTPFGFQKIPPAMSLKIDKVDRLERERLFIERLKNLKTDKNPEQFQTIHPEPW